MSRPSSAQRSWAMLDSSSPVGVVSSRARIRGAACADFGRAAMRQRHRRCAEALLAERGGSRRTRIRRSDQDAEPDACPRRASAPTTTSATANFPASTRFAAYGAMARASCGRSARAARAPLGRHRLGPSTSTGRKALTTIWGSGADRPLARRLDGTVYHGTARARRPSSSRPSLSPETPRSRSRRSAGRDRTTSGPSAGAGQNDRVWPWRGRAASCTTRDPAGGGRAGRSTRSLGEDHRVRRRRAAARAAASGSPVRSFARTRTAAYGVSLRRLPGAAEWMTDRSPVGPGEHPEPRAAGAQRHRADPNSGVWLGGRTGDDVSSFGRHELASVGDP